MVCSGHMRWSGDERCERSEELSRVMDGRGKPSQMRQVQCGRKPEPPRTFDHYHLHPHTYTPSPSLSSSHGSRCQGGKEETRRWQGRRRPGATSSPPLLSRGKPWCDNHTSAIGGYVLLRQLSHPCLIVSRTCDDRWHSSAGSDNRAQRTLFSAAASKYSSVDATPSIAPQSSCSVSPYVVFRHAHSASVSLAQTTDSIVGEVGAFLSNPGVVYTWFPCVGWLFV